MRRHICIALLLLLASFANAQPPPVACFTGQMYGRDTIISLTILLMLFIISIAYMVANFLHRIEWQAWVKNEFYQVIVSAVIAVSMIMIADLSCWVSYDIVESGRFAGSGGDAFQVAYTFLDSNYEAGLSVIYRLYAWTLLLEFMANFHIMSATNPLFITPAYPGLASIAQNIHVVTGIITLLVGNLMVQKIGLQIIEQTAFNIILPLGLVLRFIPITRDAGSYLIAIAFGFYIVLPLTYVMAAEVMAELPDEGLWFQFLGLPWFPVISPGRIFWLINSAGGPVMQFFYAIKNFDLIIVATFFPLLNMTITLAFVRSVGRAIIHHTG